jgi:hypothetical protein
MQNQLIIEQNHFAFEVGQYRLNVSAGGQGLQAHYPCRFTIAIVLKRQFLTQKNADRLLCQRFSYHC